MLPRTEVCLREKNFCLLKPVMMLHLNWRFKSRSNKKNDKTPNSSSTSDVDTIEAMDMQVLGNMAEHTRCPGQSKIWTVHIVHLRQ